MRNVFWTRATISCKRVKVQRESTKIQSGNLFGELTWRSLAIIFLSFRESGSCFLHRVFYDHLLAWRSSIQTNAEAAIPQAIRQEPVANKSLPSFSIDTIDGFAVPDPCGIPDSVFFWGGWAMQWQQGNWNSLWTSWLCISNTRHQGLITNQPAVHSDSDLFIHGPPPTKVKILTK